MSFFLRQKAFIILVVIFAILFGTSCNPKDIKHPTEELQIASEPILDVTPTERIIEPATALPPSGLVGIIPSKATQIIPTLESAICALNWCNSAGHFWLNRPIPEDGDRNVERTYRFGTTQEGKREIHHGVEFNNPRGTPVLAAADGIVVFAGNDKNEVFGADHGFYGNLVIIEHHFTKLDETIYTLYGHLDEVLVQTGSQVRTGDEIGKVGATGYAIGSHLHFEVRQGGMDYKNCVNPELWLNLDDGKGAIAASGEADLLSESPYPSVKIESLDLSQNPIILYIETYADENIQRDPELNEFFAVGNLPEGRYQVTFSKRGIPLKIEVEVKANQLTHIIYPSNLGE